MAAKAGDNRRAMEIEDEMPAYCESGSMSCSAAVQLRKYAERIQAPIPFKHRRRFLRLSLWVWQHADHDVTEADVLLETDKSGQRTAMDSPTARRDQCELNSSRCRQIRSIFFTLRARISFEGAVPRMRFACSLMARAVFRRSADADRASHSYQQMYVALSDWFESSRPSCINFFPRLFMRCRTRAAARADAPPSEIG
jgi:hypothetical protein